MIRQKKQLRWDEERDYIYFPSNRLLFPLSSHSLAAYAETHHCQCYCKVTRECKSGWKERGKEEGKRGKWGTTYNVYVSGNRDTSHTWVATYIVWGRFCSTTTVVSDLEVAFRHMYEPQPFRLCCSTRCKVGEISCCLTEKPTDNQHCCESSQCALQSQQRLDFYSIISR